MRIFFHPIPSSNSEKLQTKAKLSPTKLTKCALNFYIQNGYDHTHTHTHKLVHIVPFYHLKYDRLLHHWQIHWGNVLDVVYHWKGFFSFDFSLKLVYVQYFHSVADVIRSLSDGIVWCVWSSSLLNGGERKRALYPYHHHKHYLYASGIIYLLSKIRFLTCRKFTPSIRRTVTSCWILTPFSTHYYKLLILYFWLLLLLLLLLLALRLLLLLLWSQIVLR